VTAGKIVLDPRAHARRGGPDTSRSAAEDTGNARTTMLRLLLRTYADRGPLTAEEAADHAGIDQWQASKRVSDLDRLGWIEDTGQRRQGRAGRAQMVRHITDAGLRELGLTR
jgi:predicted ArsR family transcriptional regulator